MCDALQQHPELSLDLQDRTTNLNKAHNKIMYLGEKKNTSSSFLLLSRLKQPILSYFEVFPYKKQGILPPNLAYYILWKPQGFRSQEITSGDNVELANSTRILGANNCPAIVYEQLLWTTISVVTKKWGSFLPGSS